jgi:hypothetical protein
MGSGRSATPTGAAHQSAAAATRSGGAAGLRRVTRCVAGNDCWLAWRPVALRAPRLRPGAFAMAEVGMASTRAWLWQLAWRGGGPPPPDALRGRDRLLVGVVPRRPVGSAPRDPGLAGWGGLPGCPVPSGKWKRPATWVRRGALNHQSLVASDGSVSQSRSKGQTISPLAALRASRRSRWAFISAFMISGVSVTLVV